MSKKMMPTEMMTSLQSSFMNKFSVASEIDYNRENITLESFEQSNCKSLKSEQQLNTTEKDAMGLNKNVSNLPDKTLKVLI